jgi:hypothetical protein
MQHARLRLLLKHVTDAFQNPLMPVKTRTAFCSCDSGPVNAHAVTAAWSMNMLLESNTPPDVVPDMSTAPTAHKKTLSFRAVSARFPDAVSRPTSLTPFSHPGVDGCRHPLSVSSWRLACEAVHLHLMLPKLSVGLHAGLQCIQHHVPDSQQSGDPLVGQLCGEGHL